MKPVIAVAAQTASSYTEYYGEQTVSGVYDLYVRALRRAGALPVVLAPGDPSDAPELLSRVDALLIPGGGDIDPGAYGEAQQADTLYGIRPEADLFEIALVREAARSNLPFLGICRGLQVLNVAFGGSLHQDLPEHPQDLMGRAFAGHYRTSIESGTRLHTIAGGNELVINSLHHQGVKDLGEGLRVAATATDGVVESIEPTDDSWDAMAVQWHPECLRKEHATALFEWLADAASLRMGRLELRLMTEPVEIRPTGRKAAAAS